MVDDDDASAVEGDVEDGDVVMVIVIMMVVNVRDTWQLLAMAPPSSRLHFENVTLVEIFQNIWVSKVFNTEIKMFEWFNIFWVFAE